MTTVTLVSDEIAVDILPEFNQEGEIMIRQTNPVPTTLVLITIEVAVDG